MGVPQLVGDCALLVSNGVDTPSQFQSKLLLGGGAMPRGKPPMTAPGLNCPMGRGNWETARGGKHPTWLHTKLLQGLQVPVPTHAPWLLEFIVALAMLHTVPDGVFASQPQNPPIGVTPLGARVSGWHVNPVAQFWHASPCVPQAVWSVPG
jgi:hypothetical protein